jgi:uncharacterized protein YqjF (DUF2071 family)
MLIIDDYPITSRRPVTRPVMLQAWKHLTYVHWPYDPAVVQQRLPEGLTVDVLEGQAWVGLVAFRMEGIRLPGLKPVPYWGTFPETNVRTYVRGPDGRPGVWFDSLDITRLVPVVVAQSTYRLPYMWSDMDINFAHDAITYRTRRRWPGPSASSMIAVRPGRAIPTPSPLERFLTARWGLWTRLGKRLAYAPVDHRPWPLQEAELVDLNDELMMAAGYPPSAGHPLVHYSNGVDVRIGLPRRAGA